MTKEALIKNPRERAKKVKTSVDIPKYLLDNVKEYCKEQEITKDYFFEEAVKAIFKKCKWWKEHRISKKETAATMAETATTDV